MAIFNVHYNYMVFWIRLLFGFGKGHVAVEAVDVQAGTSPKIIGAVA
jgi:hypothetical protein